ncbi:hypothetical protein H072_2578 [Dactylellina haptotyla CBS 200.50]|uniref:Nucleolar protein 9 n=1 Tax=Dactylellina haptotyla (strain CBS 200.50) TaxID=1284197 RepID=S8AKH1_DACHA|nr:hypothetical protein H072_2578 [Dactylellina haptotyla CBS 200.50]
MPKELKKRGRRETKRQKTNHDGDTQESVAIPTAQGLALPTQVFVAGEDSTATSQLAFESSIGPAATFYGLLDEQEQEYFRKADDMLEANQFNSEEGQDLEHSSTGLEREAFTQNVLKETENKELKMACSQGCSRLLEKLLIIADPHRVKIIFQRFHGHFPQLMSHRFASHCCEALFTAAASIASIESLEPNKYEPADSEKTHTSAENLFLCTITELEPSIDNLLMDPFGAHPLRTLFLVLSGAPLESQSYKSLVHSKKKENSSLAVDTIQSGRIQARSVPESFREALSRIINTITGDITRESIRNLATDPLGCPTLQLLIELDLGRSRKFKTKIEESLVGKLLLALPEEEERDAEATGSFFRMLLQDKIGSHLLERVMTCVPKKTFNILYTQYFKNQMGKLATSETACYVVVKVLEKLEEKELKNAEMELREGIPLLLAHNRIAVVRSVIENCEKQGFGAKEFCDTLFKKLGSDKDDELGLLLGMLDIKSEELESLDMTEVKEKGKRNPGQLHASLLVQTLLMVPGQCSQRVKNCITACSGETVKRLCKHPTASHAIQKSLVTDLSDVAFRRKLAGLLSGSIVDLALDPIGSHVIDTLWEATMHGLKLQRQRIADELMGSERKLRDSFHGRAVWRNWKMDMYKTRRYDWNSLTAASNGSNSPSVEVKKSALQMASERYAAAKKEKEGRESGDRGTSKEATGNKRKHPARE